METVLQDVRYAFRTMRKSPGFALVIILVLGLGMGVNTAIFGVIDAVLLRPLPYKDPDRLVRLWMNFAGIGLPKDQNAVSAPEFKDVRELSRSFSEISIMGDEAFNIKIGGIPEQIHGERVSADFFSLFGIKAELGRFFLSSEGVAGRENVIVLSHGFWQSRFGGDRNILGQTLVVNSRSCTVIGVAPPGFQYPSEIEAWAPLSFSANDLSPDSRGNHGYGVIARIKPGLSIDQARADMQAVSERMIEQNPTYPYRQFHFRVIMNPLLDEIVGDVRPALWLLMGAVGFVLLIACANVANLLMTRATAREREIAIRTALGADRWRVIRQLLTESLILAILGSAVGLFLARLGLSALISHASMSVPRLIDARLDGRVLLFTMLISVLTAIIFGLAPSLQASRASYNVLKERGRTAFAGSHSSILRRVLVSGEIALSLMLLAGAGLLIKSFFRLQEVDPGFKSEGVITLRIALSERRYSKPEQLQGFFRELIERASRLPGVTAVGGVSDLPLSGSGSSGTTTVDSQAVSGEERSPEADWRVVTPGYFSAMSIPLLQGRYFTDRDTANTAPVAIIDESLAQTYWPGEDPIGKRLHPGGQGANAPWMTIVGVVGHVRYATLEARSRVELYWPYAQNPGPTMGLAVRTTLDPGSLAKSIEREVINIDPDQPVAMVRTMEQLLGESLARRRFLTFLLLVFAGCALALAAVGIYGVISYGVNQRTQEMGIRMALGATRSGVLRLVLEESLWLSFAGIGIGLAGSFVLARFAAGLLFDVKPVDPATHFTVAAFLFVVALAASALPAYRATRVDPIEVLRTE